MNYRIGGVHQPIISSRPQSKTRLGQVSTKHAHSSPAEIRELGTPDAIAAPATGRFRVAHIACAHQHVQRRPVIAK